MEKFLEKLRDYYEDSMDRYRDFVANINLSAVHLGIFFGVLALVILTSLKFFSSKYFASTKSEVVVLDRVVGIIDKTLSDPGACEETLRGAYRSYTPKKLRTIKSANGYVEFQIEQKPTNSFEFSGFTAQLINIKKDMRTLLLKFSFKHLTEKKIYDYFKLLNIEFTNNKISRCQIGPKIRL